MPSEKKPRQKFIAELRTDKTETYQKILNKIINPDLQQSFLETKRNLTVPEQVPEDTISKILDEPTQDQNLHRTEPTISLADNKLSQASLANNELSQLLAKPTINQEKILGQPLAKPTISLANYYRTWNYLDDEIMPNLHPSEQLVLRRLYRLSYGFNRELTDNVSLAKIAEKCNLGVATIKLAIKSLQDKGLIEIESDLSRNPNGGNKYRVLNTLINSLAKDELSQLLAKPTIGHIKHDDDPLKGQDHHQTEHEKSVMMIYQQTTGNSWTKADTTTYNKIKNIPLQAIETAIKLATQRASSRPNSLAYFIKEIIATANPPKQNRSQRKKALEKIVQQVRNSFIGSNYSMSDFTYKVKDLCLRDDIAFDNDIFDEVMNKKNG